MKKKSICILIFIILSYTNTFALSFFPWTIWLNADTQLKCDTLWGNFIKWEKEIHCTKIELSSYDLFIKTNPTCKVATDGCNAIKIWNSEAIPITNAFCSESNKNKWSCMDKIINFERAWFLIEKERKEYFYLKENLWDDTSMKIQSAVLVFWDKITKKSPFDTKNNIKYFDSAILSIEQMISDLLLSYSSGEWMSDYDNKKYNLLTLIKLEIKIMKNISNTKF